MRLIDADALSNEVDKSKHCNPHPQSMIRVNHRNEHDHFLRMIMDAPTVDAVEVVHGKWLGERGDYICSVCGSEGPDDGGYWASPYCPSCGAKMDGGNKNE